MLLVDDEASSCFRDARNLAKKTKQNGREWIDFNDIVTDKTCPLENARIPLSFKPPNVPVSLTCAALGWGPLTHRQLFLDCRGPWRARWASRRQESFGIADGRFVCMFLKKKTRNSEEAVVEAENLQDRDENDENIELPFFESADLAAVTMSPATQSVFLEMRAGGRFLRKSQHIPRQINDMDFRMNLPVLIMTSGAENARPIRANFPAENSHAGLKRKKLTAISCALDRACHKMLRRVFAGQNFPDRDVQTSTEAVTHSQREGFCHQVTSYQSCTFTVGRSSSPLVCLSTQVPSLFGQVQGSKIPVWCHSTYF